MSQALQDRMAERGVTVASAESLTGGLVAARLTELPGSSRSYVGGVVAYATEVKVHVLGVPQEVVDEHGVISEACAAAMATGVRELMGATYGVSTTGVAGPEAQEGHQPGTVWIAVAGPAGVHTELLDLDGLRGKVQQATVDAAVRALDGVLRREEPGLG